VPPAPLPAALPLMAAKLAAVISTVPPWFQMAPTPRPAIPPLLALLPWPPPPPPPPPAPMLLLMTDVPTIFRVPVAAL
jgi:hypothetical protein